MQIYLIIWQVCQIIKYYLAHLPNNIDVQLLLAIYIFKN